MSSFIKYNGKGLWFNDMLLELSVEYITITKKELSNIPKWLEIYLLKIEPIRYGFFSDFNSFWFDENLYNKDRIKLFVQVLDKTIEKLKSKEEYITGKEINSFRCNFHETSEYDNNSKIKTLMIINTLVSLKEMLLYNKGGTPDSKMALENELSPTTFP